MRTPEGWLHVVDLGHVHDVSKGTGAHQGREQGRIHDVSKGAGSRQDHEQGRPGDVGEGAESTCERSGCKGRAAQAGAEW